MLSAVLGGPLSHLSIRKARLLTLLIIGQCLWRVSLVKWYFYPGCAAAAGAGTFSRFPCIVYRLFFITEWSTKVSHKISSHIHWFIIFTKNDSDRYRSDHTSVHYLADTYKSYKSVHKHWYGHKEYLKHLCGHSYVIRLPRSTQPSILLGYR